MIGQVRSRYNEEMPDDGKLLSVDDATASVLVVT